MVFHSVQFPRMVYSQKNNNKNYEKNLMLFERTERTERTACLRLCCTNVENLFHRCCVHATFSSLSISLLLLTAIMGVFLRRYTSYTNTDYAHIYIINAYIRLAWIILFRMQRVRVQCAMFAPDPAQYCSYVADYGFWPFFFFFLSSKNALKHHFIFICFLSLFFSSKILHAIHFGLCRRSFNCSIRSNRSHAIQ